MNFAVQCKDFALDQTSDNRLIYALDHLQLDLCSAWSVVGQEPRSIGAQLEQSLGHASLRPMRFRFSRALQVAWASLHPCLRKVNSPWLAKWLLECISLRRSNMRWYTPASRNLGCTISYHEEGELYMSSIYLARITQLQVPAQLGHV